MVVAGQTNSLRDLPISEKVKKFVLDCLHKGIAFEDIGYEFEKTKLDDNSKKKKNGQFYTPEYIVQYMLDYLLINRLIKIVDPACGTGSFLLPVISKLATTEAEVESVYGFDLDNEAIEVLKAILHLQGKRFKNENLIHGNTIVENKEISANALNLKKISPEEGFDVVIGNPPYITLKKDIDYDPTDPAFKDLITGQVNAATLMIGKGLSILKENGILAFVLPKNILHVNSYGKLRKHLLEKTTILHIVDIRSSFKNVRGEQIILFVQKKEPSSTHKIEIKVVHSNNFNAGSIFIDQKSFQKQNKIYVFEKKEDFQLIERLTSISKTLTKVVDGEIFRGISVPTKNKHAKGVTPYISGKSIQKFSFHQDVYINKEELSNSKIPRITRKKIVMQNIFSSEAGLICAFDNKGVLTNETVTNIIIEDDSRAKYILGLLNTKLANYFLIFGCYNCSKMTMHTDKEYVGSIPIIFPEDDQFYGKIIKVVHELHTANGNSEQINQLKKQLDDYFFTIYDLNKDEIQTIQDGLDLFLSKKSRW